MLEVKLGHVGSAALFCFVLLVPCFALAQGLEEATALDQQEAQLYKQGHFSEALPLALRALSIREKTLGPDHPNVAGSLTILANLYQALGRYGDAEPLYKRSLVIFEKTFGPDHPYVALAENHLANIYASQGRYADAAPLYKRSLAIQEKAHGPDHPDVAIALNNLALVYQAQGRYASAERLHKRSLAIQENAHGPDHPDVATALNNLAELYDIQGRYADAEPLLKRSLVIFQKAFGPDHPNVATALNNLAALYEAQARYAEAERLDRRSLAIRERVFGPNHPDVATSLNSLALLYQAQGRYADSEPPYKRALVIDEKAFGPDHPIVAKALNNLAALYEAQGRYADAERLLKRSLAIREKASGPADVAKALNNLAYVYVAQGRYAEAEPLYKRSLVIREKAFGPDHPDVAQSLGNLAELYRDQGRYAEAEPVYKRALAIVDKAFGPDHPEVAHQLNNLALLYGIQGRYADAERLYKRSLSVDEKALGPNHPDIAAQLNNLAALYVSQGRYADAEPLYQRSLAITEKAFGPDHPNVATALNNLAELYSIQGRHADVESLVKRSLAIREKALGPDHPAVAVSLNSLAELYRIQGRYAEAEPLDKRSLAIREKALGPDHPDVAIALNNLALVYQAQGRYADTELLYKRSLAIFEKAFGLDHPNVALALNNLAELYRAQRRYADAEPLYKRSLAIREKALGPNHPYVGSSLNSLAALYQAQRRYADALPIVQRTISDNFANKSIAFAVLYGVDSTNLNPPSGLGIEVDMKDGLIKVVTPIDGSPAQKAGVMANDIITMLDDEAVQGMTLSQAVDKMRGPVNSKIKLTIMRKGVDKPIVLTITRDIINVKSVTPALGPKEALDASYTVLQRSVSSAAGEAISKLAVRLAVGTDELAQFVRRDQDLTAEAGRLDKSIVAAVSKSPNQRNPTMEQQIRQRISEINLERAKLQEVLTQRYPGYSALSKPQPLTIEQTQALLDDDEALVAIDLDQKSYVWVVTKDRAEWKALSVSAQDVSKEIATLRTGLDPNAKKQFDRNLAYQLYQQLLKPIEAIITQKKRLSFVFDGALTSLPPQVLITSNPRNKDLASLEWLVRKYAVTVLPSVESLKVLRGEQSVVEAPKPMIGYGDPVLGTKVAARNRGVTGFYDRPVVDTTALRKCLGPLPDTATELDEVGGLLGAKPEDIKLGQNATVTDVTHERLSEYRVVYFATHALVADDYEKCKQPKAEPALVLSIPAEPSKEDNGLLTASEVATLKLNADFVVLSACNTAGDEPGAEALSGLARAFFYAGARSLVVSHWEVDSEATVKLMDGLFAALKGNPSLSRAEALRLSMLKMIDHPSEPGFSQPSFWAPFVIVGEPRK